MATANGIMDWESLRKIHALAAGRIARAVNGYEAAIGRGNESFAGETLLAALDKAGLAGIICGGLEYRAVITAGGETALQRKAADRKPAAPVRLGDRVRGPEMEGWVVGLWPVERDNGSVEIQADMIGDSPWGMAVASLRVVPGFSIARALGMAYERGQQAPGCPNPYLAD